MATRKRGFFYSTEGCPRTPVLAACNRHSSISSSYVRQNVARTTRGLDNFNV